MAEDSSPVPLGDKRHRLVVDRTLNIPTLVALLGMFGALAAAYSTAQERIATAEVKVQTVEKAAEADKRNIDRTLMRIEEEVRDLRRAVESINRREARANGGGR